MPPLNHFQKSCLSLAIGNALISSPITQAATITVNTIADGVPGQTVNCSLREAVEIFNTFSNSPPSADGCTVSTSGSGKQINFNLPAGSTIGLTQGELAINHTMSINGPGQNSLTIDARGDSRIFNIDGFNSISTSISGLTLVNGYVPYLSGSLDDGGGIRVNDSTLISLSSLTISNSTSEGNGGGLAIINSSVTSIANSTISDNDTGNGAGIFIRGSDNISIDNSTISNNIGGGYGGGINIIISSRTSISNSTISNNIGDGINIYVSSRTSISNSTISNNTSTYTSGGITNRLSDSTSILYSTINGNNSGVYVDDSNSFIIKNSTISTNALENRDAGIRVTDSNIDVYASTIVNNYYGIATSVRTTVTLHALNVLANNTERDCINGGVIIGAENWIGDNTCNSSLINGDPQLGPLQDNGGPTLTHAPLAGSGLINAASFNCTNSTIGGVDQRGETRGTSSCFIGAVEGVQEDDTNFIVIPLGNGRTAIVPL